MSDYNLRFILPIAPAIDKYSKRLADMKKYGLLNVGSHKVLVTLLVESEYRDYSSLTRGWDPGIDVEYIRMPFKSVEHKFAHFYLYELPYTSDRADWVIRIDDDSSTDIDALMHYLREYNVADPHHLIAEQCGGLHDMLGEYRGILHKLGVTDTMMHRWNHSWEISVDSKAAIHRLVTEPKVRDLYFEALNLTTNRSACTDQIYCYALRFCGVFPHITNFLSKASNIHDYSYTGGSFAHIHYVAHDIENWDAFVETIEEVANGL